MSAARPHLLRPRRTRRSSPAPCGRSSSSVCRPSSPHAYERQRRVPRAVPRGRRRAGRHPHAGRRPPPALHRQARRCATPTPPACALCGLDNIIEVHSTSGTTGKPTPIWASRAATWTRWALRNARSMWMIGLRPGDLLQNCFGYGLPDERRPAVRRPARRHRRRARRHRPPGAAHRPHRRPRRDGHLHHAVLRAVPRRQGARSAASTWPPTRSCASACSAPSPGPSRAATGSRAAMGVDVFNEYGMGEFLGPGMAARVPGQAGHARLVGPPARGVHRPGDLRAGRRRRPRRARLDLADQRLDGDDPLPQPRHQLADLGALRLRPHASHASAASPGAATTPSPSAASSCSPARSRRCWCASTSSAATSAWSSRTCATSTGSRCRWRSAGSTR